MNTHQKVAKIAGIAYLLVIIFGSFSELFVRSSLIVPGDATATAQHIRAAEGLYRIGFISDMVMIMCYLILGLLFYLMLKKVYKNLALLMLSLNLVGVPIMALNMLNYFMVLVLLGGADYLKVFDVAQINALTLLFLEFHKYGYAIAAISFGSWLFPLGYLFFKSGYVPKFVGILVMISSLGFLIDFLSQFLFPNTIATLSLIAGVLESPGELILCLWLLFKGINESPRENFTRVSV